MDRYEILSALGSGSFGEVYRARHRRTGRTVAVKRLRLRSPSLADALALAEVAALRLLSGDGDAPHPNIVRIHEVIREADGSLQLVFEYMAGGNLYDLIRRAAAARAAQHQQEQEQLLPHRRIKSIASSILTGLAFLNSRGLIHRDVKPENILLRFANGPNSDQDPTVKIADLGLAKSRSAAGGRFTSYVSTRWYRCPELLLRSPRYTATVDAYAVGCIVAELYNLAPLFPGQNELDQLWRVMAVVGVPTERAWPEGMRLARRLGVARLPALVPYGRRREYQLEQRQLEQRQQLEQLAVAGQPPQPPPAPVVPMNAILHVPLDRILRAAPAAARSLAAALLTLDPARRPDAAGALGHDYFADPDPVQQQHQDPRRHGHLHHQQLRLPPPPPPPPPPQEETENGGTTGGLAGAGTVKKRGRTVGGGRRPSPSTSGGHSPMANADNTRKRSKVRRQVEERQDPQGERTVRGRNGDEQRTSTTGSTELEDAATSSMNNITPVGEESSSSDPMGGGFGEWLLAGK